MKIQQPPVDTEWKVIQSHVVDHPPVISADTLAELRSRVQVLANTRPKFGRSRRPYGPLEYRYECDENDLVTTVHAYFKNHKAMRVRFMKLSRV